MSKHIIILIVSVIFCTGCSFSRENTINYDKETMVKDISNVLLKGRLDGESSFENDVDIDTHRLSIIGNESKVYFSRNACYIHESNLMYRFQLNENGKIESYICYRLEE